MNELTETQQSYLTREEFHQLAEVPPAVEWFANIDNPNTRRAYENDVRSFAQFIGITTPDDMCMVTRAHIIAWRKALEQQKLGPATIRRKLSALSALFGYLCEKNAIADNPVQMRLVELEALKDIAGRIK